MFYVGVGPCQEGQKSQKFKAIVDMLAISNTHFKKLKDFIHMQLPSGFPVKISSLWNTDRSYLQKSLCSTSSMRGSPSPISRPWTLQSGESPVSRRTLAAAPWPWRTTRNTAETELDPHGWTALMLTIMLGQANSAKIQVEIWYYFPKSW